MCVAGRDESLQVLQGGFAHLVFVCSRVFLKWNGHFLLVLLVQSRLILDESAIQPTRTIQGCVEAVEEEMPGAGNTAERLDSG